MSTMYLINVSPKKPAITGTHGPRGQVGYYYGYGPASLRAAYDLPATGGNGAIAIVDAYDNPTILADFNAFCTTYGLPTETSTNRTSPSNKVLQVVYAGGTQPLPDPDWAGEIALDVEWAHSIAPQAKIYLVEAPDASNSLYTAVLLAQSLPNVHELSMSWGGGEDPTELGFDSDFPLTGKITFFASAGDVAAVRSYPAESPNVVAVGGTSLIVVGDTVYSEGGWSASGGGPSTIEPEPIYQSGVSLITGFRGCPDESADADPDTGVAVYSQYAFGGWAEIGGTSLSSPVCAAEHNLRAVFDGPTNEHSRIYADLGGVQFRDIVFGGNGVFNCLPGYDFVTGCGSPVGLTPFDVDPGSAYVPYNTADKTNTVAQLPSAGFLEAGNTLSLDGIDGNWYSIASTLVQQDPGQGGPLVPMAQLETDFPLAGAQVQSLLTPSVSLTTQTSDYATVEVFAYNYSYGQFSMIGSFHGSSTTQTVSVPFSSLPSYVSPTGNVKVLVRAFVPARYNIGFMQLSLDQVQFQAYI